MLRKLKINQIIVVTMAAIIAWSLLTLAWPRMKASYRFLPVDLAIDRYYEQRIIPAPSLTALISIARQSLDLHEHYRYYDGLSFLHYLRGLDVYTPALERRAEYRKAEEAAIEAVKRAPAHPEAWLRIATVRAILRDEPESIIQPWKMSVFTGRTHSTLLVPRVAIGLPLAGLMDSEGRGMLRDQLLLAWELKPAELLRVLKQQDPGLQQTRALAGAIDPSAILEMEARLEKIR